MKEAGIQRRQFDLYNIAIMHQRIRANNHHSKSLLLNQKNKFNQPLPIDTQPLKNKVTTRAQKAILKQQSSPTSVTTTLSLDQFKTQNWVSQKIQSTINPFSKSEQQTKAQHEEYSQQSSVKQKGWRGILLTYKEQITGYMRKRQKVHRVDGTYLTHGHIITAKMRVYLVRHMFKIYHRFDLLRVTLHLAVHYLDFFFSKRIILKDQLEAIVIAQACLFIAMKYEQIYPPDLCDWVERKHRNDVIKMEARIISSLDFQLAHYTVQHHLQTVKWQQGLEQDEQISEMNLLADLTLFDVKTRQLPPSDIAKAIYFLCQRQNTPDQQLQLLIKWTVQRNKESLYWLKQQKYSSLDLVHDV